MILTLMLMTYRVETEIVEVMVKYIQIATVIVLLMALSTVPHIIIGILMP